MVVVFMPGLAPKAVTGGITNLWHSLLFRKLTKTMGEKEKQRHLSSVDVGLASRSRHIKNKKNKGHVVHLFPLTILLVS